MVWFRMKWRCHNRHNETTAMNRFHINNINVGKKTYGPIEVLYDGGAGRLTIGNYCSIAKDVKFFLGEGITIVELALIPFNQKCIQGRGCRVEMRVWILSLKMMSG